MKKLQMTTLAIAMTASLLLTGCFGSGAPSSAAQAEQHDTSADPDSSESSEAGRETKAATAGETTILLAAAASLKNCFDNELIPMFQEKYPNITVEATYASSGNLQTQIEEGLEADVFISAATKQMNALKETSLVDADSIMALLENRIVLIAPVDSDTAIDSFEKIAEADIIAIGDPQSVPAGQYAEEALQSLGVYDAIQPKLSLGTDVTEVLKWVAAGSADVGIVYATDAASDSNVKILAEAPAGSLAEKVIYPVGMVSVTKNEEAARQFISFLTTQEALDVFETYGFTPNV